MAAGPREYPSIEYSQDICTTIPIKALLDPSATELEQYLLTYLPKRDPNFREIPTWRDICLAVPGNENGISLAPFPLHPEFTLSMHSSWCYHV